MTRYRRSQGDLTEGRRSHSRGRNDKYDRYDRDRSYSSERDHDRGEGENWEEKIKDFTDKTFDPTMQGLGTAAVGAVIGGLAGRQFGKKNKQRDIILGAVVGGLGANIAEKRYKDYKGKDKRDEREDDYRYDGRSRSAMR